MYKTFVIVVFCGITGFLLIHQHQRHSSYQNRKLYGLKINGTASKQKPGYFQNGKPFPHKMRSMVKLFPGKTKGDRIIEQLTYVPGRYIGNSPIKVIFVSPELKYLHRDSGMETFQQCSVKCTLIQDLKELTKADAVLLKNEVFSILFYAERSPKQVWILYLLESPDFTGSFAHYPVFNWTATYRQDSDIVTPNKKWAYYDLQITQKRQLKNYAAHKTKKVAWFVSSCKTRNNRLEYAIELAKYIPVDIYGYCGSLKCAINNPACFKMLEKDYKFYLAFENSNCQDYITETFYVNSLQHNVLPIVMGARLEDYKAVAPKNSYLHVDNFTSPEELAKYLHKLDKDDDLYNLYFQWKGTGEFINTYFWCRLCAMLNSSFKKKYYTNIEYWWSKPGTCTHTSWNKSLD